MPDIVHPIPSSVAGTHDVMCPGAYTLFVAGSYYVDEALLVAAYLTGLTGLTWEVCQRD